MNLLRCLGVAVLLGTAGVTHAETAVVSKPVQEKWVYDEAFVLDTTQIQRLNQFLKLFQENEGVTFYAIIVPNLLAKPITEVAASTFEQWRVGENSKGRGLLFILALKEHQVRLEVGYALEGIYTDAFVSYIEQKQMAPFFEQNHVVDGFSATLELIVQRIKEKEPEKFSATPDTASSSFLTGGAGADTAIALGNRSAPIKTIASDDIHERFRAQPSPEATFELYIQHDQLHITDPDLGIYTPITRDFFRKWTVTQAQMDNEYHTYAGKKYEVKINGDRSVIRFPVQSRNLSPYFLQKSAEGWQLDFATMTESIRFNNENEWHLANQNHSYKFAFSDWDLDRNGFPHPGQHNELPPASSSALTNIPLEDSPKALRKRLEEALGQKNFSIIEAWVNDLVLRKQYDVLTDIYRYLPTSADLLPTYNTWCEQSPNSHVAYLARGVFYVESAWRARGSGWAKEVSESSFMLFKERLMLAEKDLEKAQTLEPNDPSSLDELIRVATGLGQERETVDALLAKVEAVAPYHYRAHFSMLSYLLPRWHGSVQEALDFARKASSQAPKNSRLSLLYAHAQTLIYTGDQGKQYLQQASVWNAVESTFQNYFKVRPTDIRMHNYFAYYAYKAKHYEMARKELELIGDDWDESAWDSQKFFNDVRRYVFSKTTPS